MFDQCLRFWTLGNAPQGYMFSLGAASFANSKPRYRRDGED